MLEDAMIDAMMAAVVSDPQDFIPLAVPAKPTLPPHPLTATYKREREMFSKRAMAAEAALGELQRTCIAREADIRRFARDDMAALKQQLDTGNELLQKACAALQAKTEREAQLVGICQRAEREAADARAALRAREMSLVDACRRAERETATARAALREEREDRLAKRVRV